MQEPAALAALAAMVATLLRLVGKPAWLALMLGALVVPIIVQLTHFVLPGGLVGSPRAWPMAALVNTMVGTVAAVLGLIISVPVLALRQAGRARGQVAALSAVALCLTALPAVVALAKVGWPTLPFVVPRDDFKRAIKVSLCDTNPLGQEPHEMKQDHCVPLSAEQFRRLVAPASYRYDRGWFKGATLLVVTLPDGQVRHLALSYWGGFFKATDEPGIWILPESPARELGQLWRDILERDFIPERMRRDRAALRESLRESRKSLRESNLEPLP